MSFKDFDQMLQEKLGGRPTFTVGGQTFEARSKLPWRKFSTLILSMSGEDVSSKDGIDKTEEFFRLVLLPKDRQRFIDLLSYDGDEEEDDEHVVAPQQVSELLDWLLQYYTGKTLTSEDSSSPTPLDTGLPANGHSELQVISLNPKV